MLNIILSALPILGSLIPKGKTADIVAAGTKVAQEVFGTTDEKEIVSKLESDPALAEQFKAKLEAETSTLRMQIEDTQDARAKNNELASMNHAGYWSGPVIDVVVVVGFFSILALLIFRPVTMDQTQFAVANILLGALSAAFAQVINYHRGSSAGSAAKDAAIKQIASK
jgi:hypothetical protein